MKARLRTGERSSKYRPGQFVSADYARRYPLKVQLVAVEARRLLREVVAPPAEEEEWEVTVRYRSTGQVVDMTIRIIVPVEFAPASKDDVRAAAWRVAHGRTLTKFQFAGCDWRREYQKRGRARVYEGESDNPEDATSFKGLFRTVGYERLRVALVEA